MANQVLELTITKKYSGSGLSESNLVLCAVETHFRAYLKSFLTTFRKAQIGECIITKPKKRKRPGEVVLRECSETDTRASSTN
jgi:hypothetical protein